MWRGRSSSSTRSLDSPSRKVVYLGLLGRSKQHRQLQQPLKRIPRQGLQPHQKQPPSPPPQPPPPPWWFGLWWCVLRRRNVPQHLILANALKVPCQNCNFWLVCSLLTDRCFNAMFLVVTLDMSTIGHISRHIQLKILPIPDRGILLDKRQFSLIYTFLTPPFRVIKILRVRYCLSYIAVVYIYFTS